MEKYEYKVLQSDGLPSDWQLNELNELEGWRVIAIVPVGILFFIYLERRK